MFSPHKFCIAYFIVIPAQYKSISTVFPAYCFLNKLQVKSKQDIYHYHKDDALS